MKVVVERRSGAEWCRRSVGGWRGGEERWGVWGGIERRVAEEGCTRGVSSGGEERWRKRGGEDKWRGGVQTRLVGGSM